MNDLYKASSENLTPEQTANYLQVSVRTLAKWRSTSEVAIPFSKVGRCVRYRLPDLQTYLSKHSFNSVEG